MKEVTVDRLDLLKSLEDNLTAHLEQYDLAVEGFWVDLGDRIQDAQKVLDKLAKVQSKEKQETFDKATKWVDINPAFPTSYASHYERAIGMLTMHVEDTITLTTDEYRQYIEDEWDWKRQFTTGNQTYLSKSSMR